MTYSWQRLPDRPAVPRLDLAARRSLAVIAATLIPGDEQMPSAAEVDVAGERLDAVLLSRFDLAAPLRRVLASPPDADVLGWLEELRGADPPGHRALVVAILATYYLSAEVRERLGYPGQSATEINIGFPAYVEEGLLDAVVGRGPIHREVDVDAAPGS